MARAASKPERPKDVRVHEIEVARATRLSSSFVRVTFTGDDEFDRSFRHVGHDHQGVVRDHRHRGVLSGEWPTVAIPVLRPRLTAWQPRRGCRSGQAAGEARPGRRQGTQRQRK